MKKKLVAIFICFTIMFSTFACGKVEGPKIDVNKTQIYISLFSGGFGTEWLDEWLVEYNKTLEKYEFIRLPDNKDGIDTITQKIMSNLSSADIYFIAEPNILQLLNANKLLDLTNVYESAAPGENTLIKDKLWDYEYASTTYGKDSKIYGLPYTQGFVGFVYDHDLFELKNYYISDSTTENGLSVGMDGTSGTFDDGLPVTVEEFDALCKDIVRKNDKPFIYADTVGKDMGKIIAETMWINYDGPKNYEISYNYNGSYISPSKGTETELTVKTGYKAFTDDLFEGRFKAAEFIKDYYLNNSYAADNSDLSHTQAQGTYILSHNTPSQIAMIAEGYWWENEAERYFAEDARKNNNPDLGYGKRDFRFMPVPYYSDSSESGFGVTNMVSNGAGTVFALKQNDSEKEKMIEDFLKIYCSDERLEFFTEKSGSLLPYDYEISSETLAKLSPFSKNMIEILKSENTNIINVGYREISSPLYSSLNYPQRWEVTINKIKYDFVTKALESNSLSLYKESVKARYNEQSWSAIVSGI